MAVGSETTSRYHCSAAKRRRRRGGSGFEVRKKLSSSHAICFVTLFCCVFQFAVFVLCSLKLNPLRRFFSEDVGNEWHGLLVSKNEEVLRVAGSMWVV